MLSTTATRLGAVPRRGVDGGERRIKILTELNQKTGIDPPKDSYNRRSSIHVHALLADEIG